MAKEKNVKLGEVANSFYDPTTQVKVLMGQVVTLTSAQQVSKKIKEALRHGHLVTATDEDVEEFENDGQVSTTAKEDNWEDFEVSAKTVKSLNKDKLVSLAMYLESTYSQAELEEFTKDELKEEILDISEVEN